MNKIDSGEYHNQAKEIITRTKETRLNINRIKENLEYRINHFIKMTEGKDEMWINLRDQSLKELECLNEEEALLASELHYVGEFMDESLFKIVLQDYGYTLASTSGVMHVTDNLRDEHDLKEAINQTEVEYRKKRQELADALQEIDEEHHRPNIDEIVVVIESEIRFYEKDFESHPWGKERLEALKSELDVAKGRK